MFELTSQEEQKIQDVLKQLEERKSDKTSFSYEGQTPVRVLDHLSANQWIERKIWARVESSNVNRIRYDIDVQELYIEFNGGTVYLYRQVPSHVASDMFNTDSMGKFVHRRLKNNFPYRKIN